MSYGKSTKGVLRNPHLKVSEKDFE